MTLENLEACPPGGPGLQGVSPGSGPESDLVLFSPVFSFSR